MFQSLLMQWTGNSLLHKMCLHLVRALWNTQEQNEAEVELEQPLGKAEYCRHPFLLSSHILSLFPNTQPHSLAYLLKGDEGKCAIEWGCVCVRVKENACRAEFMKREGQRAFPVCFSCALLVGFGAPVICLYLPTLSSMSRSWSQN